MNESAESVTIASDSQRAKAWLSQGLETLWASRPDPDTGPPFDVLIVGSGYGGAVAAAELAGAKASDNRPIAVCVLERGSEYLSGSFPTRMSDLAGHVRFSTPEAATARGVRTGLFDVRVGNDVSAVLANGLGGGSLINAGVMLAPHPSVFQEARWPADIRAAAADSAAWKRLFDDAAGLLGADSVGPGPAPYAKLVAMEALGLGASTPATRTPITVALADKLSTDGVELKKCIGCGDCATGCNHGAKESLDLNLLARAKRHKASIYTGATVLKLARIECGSDTFWDVHVAHTDEKLRRREKAPLILRTRHVILAAGTFGSTEILMQSEFAGPNIGRIFSATLGTQFSANGDMIEAAYGLETSVNCVATESDDPFKTHHGVETGRKVGPTITGMIDARCGDPNIDVVVQELSVPGGLRRMFEESFTLAKTMDELASADTAAYGARDLRRDACAVDRRAIDRTLVLAMIGRDGADGRLRLNRSAEREADDGGLTVDWPQARDDPRLARHHDTLARWLKNSKLGGTALSNPMWRLLPAQLEPLLGSQRGPLLTVHPLGGCPMGDSAASGVVNHLGQVFRGQTGVKLHPGLRVLDGSIVPSSLGINPALTITALSLRAVRALRAELQAAAPTTETKQRRRPIFRTLVTITDPMPTEVELIERTSGRVSLRNDRGATRPYVVELTLCFKAKSLADLTFESNDEEAPLARQAKRSMALDPARSVLRICDDLDPDADKPMADVSTPHLEATLSGTLQLFRHEASGTIGRTLSAVPVWLLNRGVRDGAQRFFDILAGQLSRNVPPLDIGNVGRLASRAGDARLLEYALMIEAVTAARNDFARTGKQFEKQPLHTVKRLSYGVPLNLDGLRDLLARHGSNPWQQMMRMTVTRMPRLALASATPPVLELELPYLARQQVPLLHLVKQQDHPAALIDLASFALYFLRILIQVHTWSFRKPDPSPARLPQRLPGAVNGLPPPDVFELCTGKIPEEAPGFPLDTPVMIRLTRYRWGPRSKRPPDPDKKPVLLIHGYSASGTSFAHPSLPCSLAQHLCDEGRDVWIIDLRSSAGMPTASYPWSFEQIGFGDIPVAFEHIVHATGMEKIDVVAHCMGSAMLWMALLGDTGTAPTQRSPCPPVFVPLAHDTAFDARKALPPRINRLVMSQIGPAMVMAPGNIFRAYLMRYVQQFLPLTDYSFQTSEAAGVVNTLMDRVLSTLPYPPGEFQLENPLWPLGKHTPWVGSRHRMDALYGRVFKLDNMSENVLEHLNDFFGPLNIQTVSQVIHFAGNNCITDRTGFNCYVDPKRISEMPLFPMMSLHGSENGLADISTLAQLEQVLPKDKFKATPIPNYGHQDCLLGRHAKADVFDEISAFFDGSGRHA